MISRSEMEGLIAAGRAQRWTRELGPDRLVPVAAQLDGAWYVVLDGSEDYQLAPEPLTAVLTAVARALGMADDSVRRTSIVRAS